MDIKSYIKEKSKELNIDVIGLTGCEPMENLKSYLKDRKKDGREIEFEEVNIEKRINPKLTLDTCKSIIVIGVSYNNDFLEKPNYDLKGRISKSSWGKDYHKVLEGKLKGLIGEIEKVKDFEYEYFVDTGPLVDRELGKKAGIGYYGKNCSIINKEYGSFIFLGYILSDLDTTIELDEVEEACGDCKLCIENCPTGALEEAYKINPKKCISYLTQTKKRIPYKLRELMGNNIYGCDICQLVCPKNKLVKLPNHEDFIPKNTKGCIDIENLLNMSNREFKEVYGEMAGSWRGRNVLRRNSIIALGNMKGKDNLDVLLPYLDDPSPMVREYTAWSILKIDYEVGKPLIEARLKKEKEKFLSQELINLINYFAKKY